MSRPLHSGRRVTIKDIASMSGVSIGTVDRVLHNRGEVNTATRKRVMSFVEELGYTPNLLAKSLALKRNFNIVALIPEAGADNPYWEKPLAGIQRAIHELKDYNSSISVVTYHPGNERSFILNFDTILSEKPDGIILAPHFHAASLKYLRICEEKSLPCILIDTNLEASSNLAYFGQDALQSGYVAGKLMHYGLPAGSWVLVLKLAWNKAITTHLQRREEGFLAYFNQPNTNGIQIHSLEIDLAGKNEPDQSLAMAISSREVAGIFVTNSKVHKVARYLKSYPKKVFLAGYDLIDDNLPYLREGMIDFLICQKPEEQGYNSTMAMFNYLLTRKPPMKINFSPIDILVKENVAYYLQSNITEEK